MANVNEMSYIEMLDLRLALDIRIKAHRAVRIKKKWKRCGKKACFCNDGPADGSWGNLHGPYLFAQFVDSTSGKTRLVSLGKFFDQDSIMETGDRILEWWKYYQVSEAEREALPGGEKRKWNWPFFVSREKFRDLHGIWPEEDKMDRPRRFFATKALDDGFEAKSSRLAEEKEAVKHLWCAEYGLGSIEGQRMLARLLEGFYFLAD